MQDLFEFNDLYKALLALAAGIILGLERELKDKAAGLKTISVICLGSALFTILSLKVGSQYTDAARIASYIVSGIGFLGAGVIFKDRAGVNGLTTASVIWISAAIGMSIGFGEIYLAAIFLVACLFIIHTARYFNLKFFSSKKSKLLKIILLDNNVHIKDKLAEQIKKMTYVVEQVKLESHPGKLTVTFEVIVNTGKLSALEEFLVNENRIESFEF